MAQVWLRHCWSRMAKGSSWLSFVGVAATSRWPSGIRGIALAAPSCLKNGRRELVVWTRQPHCGSQNGEGEFLAQLC